MALIGILEEDVNRQFCISLDQHWINVNQTMQIVENALLRQIQNSNDPLEDRIACIECSLARIESVLDQLPSTYSTHEEATARRKEIQV